MIVRMEGRSALVESFVHVVEGSRPEMASFVRRAQAKHLTASVGTELKTGVAQVPVIEPVSNFQAAQKASLDLEKLLEAPIHPIFVEACESLKNGAR
jgi:hypothetical protein